MKQLFETYRSEELVQTNRVLNTPSDFAKKSLFYVQETGYLKSLKSHLSERSNLKSYLFLIALSGKGTFTYNDQSYQLDSNTCLLIDCMEHYSHQCEETHPWELLWVHFNGATTTEYYQQFISGSDPVFHTDSPGEYSSLIYQLIELIEHKDVNWEILSSKLLTDLLTLCITNTATTSSTKSDAIVQKLYGIKEYLDKNYQKKLLLDEIADNFYISKYHLCREYKRIFGSTIMDHITMRRITKAKELLRFTRMSIEEVALESGFSDSSYFNKVFQKVEGMTGSEYRRKW